MRLSFLASDSFEVLHVGRLNGGPDDTEKVKLRHVVAALVVRHEQSQVLHILELDKSQVNRVPFHNVLFGEIDFLRWFVSFSFVEIQSGRLIDEDFHRLGRFVLGAFEQQRVYFHRLIKRQRDDELFVAVRGQISALLREAVSQRMFVAFVETLRSRGIHFAVEEFVTGDGATVGASCFTSASHTRHTQMRANFLFERSFVSAPHGVDFGAVLVKIKGGHSLDLLRLGRLRAFVNVDFQKDGVWIFGRKGLVEGSYVPTRAAPRGGEVNHHQFVACRLQRRQKLGIIHDVLHGRNCCRHTAMLRFTRAGNSQVCAKIR